MGIGGDWVVPCPGGALRGRRWRESEGPLVLGGDDVELGVGWGVMDDEDNSVGISGDRYCPGSWGGEVVSCC